MLTGPPLSVNVVGGSATVLPLLIERLVPVTLNTGDDEMVRFGKVPPTVILELPGVIVVAGAEIVKLFPDAVWVTMPLVLTTAFAELTVKFGYVPEMLTGPPLSVNVVGGRATVLPLLIERLVPVTLNTGDDEMVRFGKVPPTVIFELPGVMLVAGAEIVKLFPDAVCVTMPLVLTTAFAELTVKFG